MSVQAGEVPPHAMTAEEYAQVRAVLERIEGLRRGMIASVAAGIFVSFIVWLATLASYTCVGFACPTYYPNPNVVALIYAASVFVPFFIIAAFLYYRVDKHIERLSRGRYLPPRVIE